MIAWTSPLCPEAYSWNVVRLLHHQDRVDSNDIIAIELHRMKSSIELAPVEKTIALLLRDESRRVRELIDEEGPIDERSITAREREVMMWLELWAVRDRWTEHSEPAFYIEEILDRLDTSNLYANARFFRDLPRAERGMANYVQRFDRLLDLHRRRLCQDGRIATLSDSSAISDTFAIRGVIPKTTRAPVRIATRIRHIGSALGRRRARIRITRTADSLLREFAFPPISESHLILHPELWELLADIDAFQAGLAGTETWRRTEEGHVRLNRLAAEARRIAREIVRFDVWHTAAELQQLATDLQRWTHA